MSARKTDRFLSIRISRFLMKTVGFWTTESKAEGRLLNGILVYTVCALGCALCIEASEIYLTKGDFYAIAYTACSSITVLVVLFKIFFFLIHRREMLRMLRYTQDNFWYARYDEYGSKLMEDIDRRGTRLICTLTFFAQLTVYIYVLTPIIENRGRNESDRVLPFNFWLGFRTDVSPNFEILFVIEALVGMHTSLCFCCFDNLLGLLNMHTAGQFKLLQHRLETILERVERAYAARSLDARGKRAMYEEFKKCVVLHHELIWYSEQMESIFMYSNLCQLLMSSIMLCLVGFQIFQAHSLFVRRLIFISHATGSFWQLFVITLTANDLLVESRAIGDAAYNANWQMLSHRDNRAIRSAVLMMMMRSARACSLSAGGFFPVSLETFMAVLSTAASYFTLLRYLAFEQTAE